MTGQEEMNRCCQAECGQERRKTMMTEKKRETGEPDGSVPDLCGDVSDGTGHESVLLAGRYRARGIYGADHDGEGSW